MNEMGVFIIGAVQYIQIKEMLQVAVPILKEGVSIQYITVC